MGSTVSINAKITQYASRVLGVIKEKYGLRDKGEALDKFAQMYGEDFVEREADEAYVKKMLTLQERHFKKYGHRKMDGKDLDELFGK